jgi:hypothetical protein
MRQGMSVSPSDFIVMPAGAPGHTITVPCCSNYTIVGGCATRSAALYGNVQVECGRDGTWGAIVRGRCLAPQQLPFRLDRPEKEQQLHFQRLRKAVSPALQKATAGRWALPQDGVLTTLSFAVRVLTGSDLIVGSASSVPDSSSVVCQRQPWSCLSSCAILTGERKLVATDYLRRIYF